MRLFDLRLLAAILILLLSFYGCRSQTKEEMLREGLRLSGEGNYTGAMVCYKNALEKDPSFFEARYQLGIGYLRTGKPEQAQKEFEKAGRQNPSFPEMPLRLAEVFLARGLPAEALAEITAFAKARPPQAEALNLSGRARALQGDLEGARVDFEAALAADPKFSRAKTDLAQILVELGQAPLAYALLTDLVGTEPDNRDALYLLARLETANDRREDALALYLRLAALAPKDLQAPYLAGIMALSLDRAAEAEKIAADLTRKAPDSAIGLQLTGLVRYQQQNFEEAVVQLQKALKIRPELTAYYFLGLSYYQLENFELALNQLQKVLDFQPKSVQARNMVAMTLLKQGRIDDAVQEVRLALGHAPDNALAHNLLGSALMAQGKFDEAMAEFDRAIELDPQLADAHVKKGVFNLARGNLAQGEEEMVRAMTIAPEALDTRLILASHHLRQQNYPEAIKVLQAGVQGKPADAVLHNTMAGAYFAQSRPEEAVAALRKAKQANPDYFTPYFNLASYYAVRGDHGKALDELSAVLQRDPVNVRALVGSGQLAEQAGQEAQALAAYEKASATHEVDGVMALAVFHARKGKPDQVLAVVDEGLKSHSRQPALTELKARVLLQAGRFEEAAATLEILEEIRPGAGYPGLIALHLGQGETAKAEALAAKVIQYRPDRSYGYLLQAGILEAGGNRDGALNFLLAARHKVRGEPQLELKIGTLYEQGGKKAEAEATYRKLAERQPRYPQPLFALGNLQDSSGKKGEALETYQKVLQIDRHYAPVLNNLAYLYVDNFGKTEEALRLSQLAYRQEPGRPEVMDTLGYVLLRSGRVAEAVPLLEKAAGLLPQSPTVLYHLALAYKDQGEAEKAAQAARKALSLGAFPEEKQSRALLARLEG